MSSTAVDKSYHPFLMAIKKLFKRWFIVDRSTYTWKDMFINDRLTNTYIPSGIFYFKKSCGYGWDLCSRQKSRKSVDKRKQISVRWIINNLGSPNNPLPFEVYGPALGKVVSLYFDKQTKKERKKIDIFSSFFPHPSSKNFWIRACMWYSFIFFSLLKCWNAELRQLTAATGGCGQ